MKLRLAIWFLLLSSIVAFGMANSGVPPFFGGSHVASFSIGNTVKNDLWGVGTGLTPGTTASATISVSAGSMVLVVVGLEAISTTDTVSSVASSHLTFTHTPPSQPRSSNTHINSGFTTHHVHGEVWWAFSSGALTSEVITVTAAAAPDAGNIQVIETKGSFNTTSPWDVNGSLPATSNGLSPPAPVTGVSISSANSVGFYFAMSENNPPPPPGAFTLILDSDTTSTVGGVGVGTSFEIFTSPQSGVTWSGAGITDWLVIGDAFAL